MNVTAAPKLGTLASLPQNQTQNTKAAASKPAESKLAQDVVQSNTIKKGVVPALKGGGAGFLVGGGLGLGTMVAIDAVTNMGSGALALMAFPMVGAPAGAIAGAVATNYADNPADGAMIGAGAGAAVGAAIGGLGGGNLGFIAWGAGIGAVAGAASGAVGALLAKHE